MSRPRSRWPVHPARVLSIRIMARLFADNDRLVQEKDGRLQGGWSRRAAANQIEKALRRTRLLEWRSSRILPNDRLE